MPLRERDGPGIEVLAKFRKGRADLPPASATSDMIRQTNWFPLSSGSDVGGEVWGSADFN